MQRAYISVLLLHRPMTKAPTPTETKTEKQHANPQTSPKTPNL